MKNLIQLYTCDIGNLHPRIRRNVLKRTKKLCTNRPTANDDTQTIQPGQERVRRSIYSKPTHHSNFSSFREKLATYRYSTSCTRIVTGACKNAKYRIIKTIRLSMDLVKELMEIIPDLKVIHLVRDPRGIINSRLHLGKFKALKTEAHSKALCKQMYLDISTVTALQHKYPDKLMTVLYEAMAERPIEAAKSVYKFLKMTYGKAVEDWVYNSTHANNNNGYYGAQRTDSGHVSVQWRNELSFSRAKMINKYCSEVFNLLGFIPFKIKEKMEDFNLPSRTRANIIGFAWKKI